MGKFLILAGAAAASTLALPSAADAQYYGRSYGYERGPGSFLNPDYAVNRCARSVARRGGRVLDVRQVRPTRAHTRVRGIASAPVRYGYGRAYRANMPFTCDVGYRGQVTNLTFDRRYY